jgi:hypothetical protein
MQSKSPQSYQIHLLCPPPQRQSIEKAFQHLYSEGNTDKDISPISLSYTFLEATNLQSPFDRLRMTFAGAGFIQTHSCKARIKVL